MSSNSTIPLDTPVPLKTDTYHLLGNLLRFLVRSHETGGAYNRRSRW